MNGAFLTPDSSCCRGRGFFSFPWLPQTVIQVPYGPAGQPGSLGSGRDRQRRKAAGRRVSGLARYFSDGKLGGVSLLHLLGTDLTSPCNPLPSLYIPLPCFIWHLSYLARYTIHGAQASCLDETLCLLSCLADSRCSVHRRWLKTGSLFWLPLKV